MARPRGSALLRCSNGLTCASTAAAQGARLSRSYPAAAPARRALPSCAVVGGGKEVAPVCLCIASQRLYLEMNERFLAFDLYWHEWTPNA